jgi:hypothetical protein
VEFAQRVRAGHSRLRRPVPVQDESVTRALVAGRADGPGIASGGGGHRVEFVANPSRAGRKREPMPAALGSRPWLPRPA